MALSKVAELTSVLAKKLDIGQSDGLLQVLKNTAFKSNATDDQMAALLIVANQYSLNPWTKEIYAFPDSRNGVVPIVGVDGWARIINNNKEFDGMDFEQDDEKCTCRIYRKDRSHAIAVTEWMSECKRNAQPWQTHPKRMLRHKAMIQCARLAFGFAGIYDQDEAERIAEARSIESNDASHAVVENIEKPMLVSGTKEWSRAIKSLKDNGSLAAVEEHMTISDESKEELYKLAEISDQPF